MPWPKKSDQKTWPNVAKRVQKQSNRDQNAVAKRGQFFWPLISFSILMSVCASRPEVEQNIPNTYKQNNDGEMNSLIV